MARMYITRSLKLYKEQVELWTTIYGTFAPQLKFDPSRISSVKVCSKCGKSKLRMQRHHIGSEFAFARIAPEIYARRYVSFLDEDIAWLCTRHHKRVHVIYAPLMQPVYQYAQECSFKGVKPNPHHLELLRQQIRKTFFKWIAIKPKKKAKKNASVARKQSGRDAIKRSRRKSRRNNYPRYGKGKGGSGDS